MVSTYLLYSMLGQVGVERARRLGAPCPVHLHIVSVRALPCVQVRCSCQTSASDLIDALTVAHDDHILVGGRGGLPRPIVWRGHLRLHPYLLHRLSNAGGLSGGSASWHGLQVACDRPASPSSIKYRPNGPHSPAPGHVHNMGQFEMSHSSVAGVPLALARAARGRLRTAKHVCRRLTRGPSTADAPAKPGLGNRGSGSRGPNGANPLGSCMGPAPRPLQSPSARAARRNGCPPQWRPGAPGRRCGGERNGGPSEACFWCC